MRSFILRTYYGQTSATRNCSKPCSSSRGANVVMVIAENNWRGIHMLKQRLMTAALLIPIIVGLVLFLSETIFLIISGIIMFMAAVEWLAFMKLKSIPGRFI